MISRPNSSQRRPVKSPQPSKALLELQKQGLELAVSPPRPSSTLQVAASHASGRSTPSDRDKPLPLEPFERRKRRSSSLYSTDTTITNIIHMYGGYQELDDIPPIPMLHHPQAYRDTVAPLLVKRLSLNQSPSPQVSSMGDALETESFSPLRPAVFQSQAQPGPPSNKTAPSFVEFSRNLRERRNDLVSPLSATSTDYHRQAAYDQLAPPSPQISAVEQSILVSETPPLPDAMSGTISDTISDLDQPDLLPTPPGLDAPSPLSPPFDEPGNYPRSSYSPSSGMPECGKVPRTSGQPWSDPWLEDEFVTHSPEAEISKLEPRKSFKFRKSSTEREQERVMSYAEAKYPGMKGEGSSGKSKSNSARSSLQQGVGQLLRSLSLSSRVGSRRRRGRQSPSREKQLAIPATPYQVYGAEIWSNKMKKKQKEGQRVHSWGKSADLITAYQSGQSQFVGVIEGARRKLIGKSSQKRRRQLKQSIILVGPTQTNNVLESMELPADGESSWI